jgi:TonB family protein
MLRAPNTEPLDLARLGPAPLGSRRLSGAAIASIAAHIVLFAIFWAMPETHFRYHDAPNVVIDRSRAVKLVAPRLPQELTQKDPNQGKVRNELDAFSSVKARPAPRIFQPPAAPKGPEPQPSPQQPSIAPPEIDVHVDLPQIAGVTGTPELPRVTAIPPKLDNLIPSKAPGAPNPSLSKAPGDLSKAPVTKAGGPGGGIVSDGDNGSSSSLEGMQLLSDPKNVDFRPYMQLVLRKVREQWFRVIPAVARTGRQGIVVLQFSVDRAGQIPKLVVANPSGVVAYDQAAVAGVSASSPFPPLPPEYNGAEIRLQLAFSYNVPRSR